MTHSGARQGRLDVHTPRISFQLLMITRTVDNTTLFTNRKAAGSQSGIASRGAPVLLHADNQVPGFRLRSD